MWGPYFKTNANWNYQNGWERCIKRITKKKRKKRKKRKVEHKESFYININRIVIQGMKWLNKGSIKFESIDKIGIENVWYVCSDLQDKRYGHIFWTQNSLLDNKGEV